MTDYKPLRDQVAEAIMDQLGCRTPARLMSGFAITITGVEQAADAAIKAVLDGMRCGMCKHWCTDEIFGNKYCSESVIEYSLDNFGCIHWEQKQ